MTMVDQYMVICGLSMVNYGLSMGRYLMVIWWLFDGYLMVIWWYIFIAHETIRWIKVMGHSLVSGLVAQLLDHQLNLLWFIYHGYIWLFEIYGFIIWLIYGYLIINYLWWILSYLPIYIKYEVWIYVIYLPMTGWCFGTSCLFLQK